MDHAGGIRAYAAQGATIVVGKGNGEHFRKVLAAPATRNPDLPARDLSRTPIVEVTDKHVLGDGTREVHAYLLENPHATGYLFGYVPEARLGFITDVWSPGTPAAREDHAAPGRARGGGEEGGHFAAEVRGRPRLDERVRGARRARGQVASPAELRASRGEGERAPGSGSAMGPSDAPWASGRGRRGVVFLPGRLR